VVDVEDIARSLNEYQNHPCDFAKMFGFKKAKAAPVEPPPEAVDRKTELAAAIRQNYSDLSALDLEMRD
jgi:hypothetical protein